MPISKFTLKNDVEITASYRIKGSLAEITRDQLEEIALASLRAMARSEMQTRLNRETESIARGQELLKGLQDKAKMPNPMSEEQAKAFLRLSNQPFEYSNEVEFAIADLIGGESSGKGRKPANIFEFGGDDLAEPEVKPETKPKKGGK